MARGLLALLVGVPVVFTAPAEGAGSSLPHARFVSLRGDTLVVTRFRGPSTRIHLPKVATTPRSFVWASFIRNGARVVVFRSSTPTQSTVNVVDIRTHAIRTYKLSAEGFDADDVAVADDGRIAFLHTLPAHDPPLCGAPEKFRLYVVDPAYRQLTELRILPPDFELDPKTHVFVDDVSWSSHGMLSYVVGACGSGGFQSTDTIVVTGAQPGAVPHSVARFDGNRSYATAWSPKGQQISFAYTTYPKGSPVTVVKVTTPEGGAQRVASPSTEGSYVDLDWSSAEPVLYTMDNGFADLNRINIRSHHAERLWMPKGHWPEGLTEVSQDGRFVALAGFTGGIVVFDVKAHRRWHLRWPRDAGDFTLG